MYRAEIYCHLMTILTQVNLYVDTKDPAWGQDLNIIIPAAENHFLLYGHSGQQELANTANTDTLMLRDKPSSPA